MTKLIIQIPCLNEAETLAITLNALPREVPGVDVVEWLIIDDGSTDNTVEVAKSCGVDHIVRHHKNQGLARAFMTGLDACLRAGADIIVNTDADNQYNADDIPKLIAPILAKKAEIAIGERPIMGIEHFSRAKKVLQRFGSWAVRVASRTDIPDAPSGFRAISRGAALRLNVFSEYTYTIEMIIQAGQKNMAIVSVPIRVNGELRPSRLVKSIPSYIQRSLITILRIFVTYRPFRSFMWPAIFTFALGGLIWLRFMYYWFQGLHSGHVQSLILGSALLGIGFQLGVVGFLAELLSVNRKLNEDIQWRLRAIELSQTSGKVLRPKDAPYVWESMAADSETVG